MTTDEEPDSPQHSGEHGKLVVNFKFENGTNKLTKKREKYSIFWTGNR